jgi:hypothetical protein
MAQSTERTFGADEAHWTGNVADVTRAYKIHIETMVKIQGFLARHAADVSLDLTYTQRILYVGPHVFHYDPNKCRATAGTSIS